MARCTASAKSGEAPALDGQRDMPLALRLSEGLATVLKVNPPQTVEHVVPRPMSHRRAAWR